MNVPSDVLTLEPSTTKKIQDLFNASPKITVS